MPPAAPLSATSPRVLVIGSGCSGLVAIKECVAEGLDVVCFEMSDDIGGLWRYEGVQEGKEVHSSVYRNTIINTSSAMMSYSDFPIPPHWPTFLHNRVILSYFKMYAKHFDLYKYIQFNTKVLSVHPLGRSADAVDGAGDSHNGLWEVIYQRDGEAPTTVIFDKVIVASGHHWKPKYATFEGLEDFKGTVIHSHYYREAHVFSDKKCLVVGIGNSAVDIAVEVSYYGKQVYLSSRSSAYPAPRFTMTAAPGDQALTRLFYMLPMFLRNAIYRWVIWFHWGRISRFGFKPKHQPFQAHATVSSELPARIGTGTIINKNNIRRFYKAGDPGATQMVEFEDGTSAEVDVVVLATGYEIGFPFLDSSRIVGLNRHGGNSVDMYKYVWPVNHQNIAFLGLIQPWGAIMPLSELQARWVARVWTNQAPPLPSPRRRLADIQHKRREMKKRYLSSDRHTIQVDAGPYMDELASQFGVKPNLARLLLSDPYLLMKLVAGNWNPHQYRLHGPGAWSGARQAILNCNNSYDYKAWKGLDEELEIRDQQADAMKRKAQEDRAAKGGKAAMSHMIKVSNEPTARKM